MRAECVVLDPTVIVSGLLRPDGTSGALLRACLESEMLVPVLTPRILDELTAMLRHASIRRHLDADPDELIAALSGVAVLVEPSPRISLDSTEEESAGDAEYFLAAQASGARFLATTEPGLLALENTSGRPLASGDRMVDCVTPESLLSWLASLQRS